MNRSACILCCLLAMASHTSTGMMNQFWFVPTYPYSHSEMTTFQPPPFFQTAPRRKFLMRVQRIITHECKVETTSSNCPCSLHSELSSPFKRPMKISVIASSRASVDHVLLRTSTTHVSLSFNLSMCQRLLIIPHLGSVGRVL